MSTVSVVTGAAGAMGSACARALAATADVLLLTDVDAERLEATSAAIGQATGTRVQTLAGDLADAAFVDTLVARGRELGALHALVQTHGLSPSMAGWSDILQVDLVAVAALLTGFLPAVVPGSTAVCIASMAGHLGAFDPAMDAVLDAAGEPDLDGRFRAAFGAEPDPGSTYRLAKRAVIRRCARAAVPWGARGGRVVSVSPGLIDTGMGRLELEEYAIKETMAELTPVRAGRVDDDTVLPGRVDDIVRAVVFLCSDDASFVSGCDLQVDGGLVAAMTHPDTR